MTTPLLRCTIVTPFATLGGSERWLLSLLENSGRLAVEVVLLEDGPLRGRLELLGVPVSVLSVGRSGADVLRGARHLAARLRATDPEIVLANGVKAASVAVPASRLRGVPVAWAKHDFSFDSSLAPWLARGCDLVLATSEAVGAAAMTGRVVTVPPARPALNPLTRDMARTEWARCVAPLPDARVVAMVGRLVAYKGVDTAIRALVHSPGWHLVAVGGDDPSELGERERLLGLAAEHGVADRVRLVGEVEAVDTMLAAVDAVAVLTRRDAAGFGGEGYSLVALEALAAGVPLIGAEGNPEVVRMASAGGLVVPPDDAEAVARALDALAAAEDPVGAGGRSLIAAHPDAAAVADRVVAALAEAALRPGAGLDGPSMTVLTCLRNEEGHIDTVIGAVAAQLGPDDEYLVVDDQSTDGTAAEIAAWAARDARIRVLSGPAINLSAARNHGFGRARHTQVACTDAGVHPVPDWLDRLRSAYGESDPVDVVIGSYDVDGGTPLKDAARQALFPDLEHRRRLTPVRRLRAKLLGRTFTATRVDGRSMACSVEAWRRAGGFDESLDSSEDAAFGYAVQATGGRTALALGARVTWEQADTWQDMARMYRTYGEWGGRAGSIPLVTRDLTRLGALLALPALGAFGGRLGGRAAVAGLTTYLGGPAIGALAAGKPPATVVRVPAVLVLKDVNKAIGCVRGLLARSRS